MNNQQINEKFSDLCTPLIADACLRLKLPLRLAPSGIRPLTLGFHIAGRVLLVRHYGSVDIFLEAMGVAQQGIFSSSITREEWTKVALGHGGWTGNFDSA